MKKILLIGIVVLSLCSMMGTSVFPSIVAVNSQYNEIKTEIKTEPHAQTITSIAYNGRLRVYVVEPESRWNMYNQEPYHFGFLGFAFNDDISIETDATFHKSITWDKGVSETNVMVIAVVYNSEQHEGYAYPPSSKPFVAYYTDATAAATPGKTGYNTVTEEFTHTVFIEEGTATWCPYCPAMAEALYGIYESGDYPFYFVAMVEDKNSEAASRLRSEYNIYGFPSAFFDGGYRVYVGGSSSESTYRSRIEASGRRVVPPLNLSIAVTSLGSGNIQINVDIINKPYNVPPEQPQAPSGEINGRQGVEYTYTTSTTDPNNDELFYLFNWGDGTNSSWIGPYASGATVSAKHTWTTKGTYNITVKAKDPSNEESDWSDPLPISMPHLYNIRIPPFLEVVFQRFPHAFPILRQLLA